MSATQHAGMTADESIAWAMSQPNSGRYELEDGRVVVDMAPERVVHVRIKTRVWRRLDDALREAGLPCEALGDGVAVIVNDSPVYELDVLVRRGAELGDETVRITDPLIVVEVGSPSTAARGAGAKLMDYFQIASLQHYLLASPETRVVVHHARGADGAITTRINHDGIVRLDPPGIVLDRFWPEGASA